MKLSIIILAAGQGTRMRSEKPKVLQSLAGRPMLRHVVECARALGAADICVVHGFGGAEVQDEFAGEKMRWALQSEQLGTGHAVMQAMPETPDDNRVLILFGDVPLLRPATLKRIIDACAPDEVGVLTVDMENPFGYGRIVREHGKVVRNVEEKDANAVERAIREINTGVQSMPAARLKGWLSRLGNSNSQGEYYLTDVLGMAVEDGIAVHGVKAESWVEVMGINDRKQLAQAERALQARQVDELMSQGVGFADPARVDIRGTLSCGKDVFIDVNAVFEGDVVLGDNVRIESNNVIRNSNIGDDNVIHPNCHIEGATTGAHCEIGPFSRLRPGAELAAHVKVGNFVEIKKSTVADGSKVNHLTYIGDTTIGKNVNVGAGTITCNYDGANKFRTIIGDNAFIGSGVELVAPVEVGAGAVIGAGSTISKDAPPDKLTLERSRQVTVPSWTRPSKKSH
ncbi:MAG: bifunctional UDP-N-acetylglucosamine diphosphorylase/glucosamine-1-phosphate N-acetyltransferase GlmU [Gammaproteobacteria bacterium]|nr:bifunctional UDP-N-acetylglucosamine diphosphorylase/glucosamine-1-phosphate N-acetyltransferase GlmU [Gammaproteobacteria bacterium]MDH4316600.1 bifunctional UDP-N-acetylglucosamine diphosphorylase/glucosamine-1-phosphate N-acetyltransferase GlmU [Gammaproteobacteria bacterium]MDH5215846.1 bifunctional UDP-N-acetylglucosamine diphosphorylase/glucosamine-1-phosphate N-acetyltransferase GlmU [Gammaproteobacteria bacterium]